ncbi:MAG: Sucraseferredoxin family protein [Acidimicrobiales bacterium]|nr:Sucraseferredoxin family protein [Acidimicrobiales bacterium]
MPPDGASSALSATAARDFLCSPWTRAQGLDPIATAGTYDTFLTIEVPLPWPKDVAELPVVAAAGDQERTRVLAVVPRQGAELPRVTRWLRVGPNRFDGRSYEAAPDRLEVLVAELADPDRDPADPGVPAGPTVLVCGHGRRDRCCGQLGTKLALDVAGRLPGFEVLRCSHTGGHRFAPTAVTLPDGRLWAHLDPLILDGIVTRTIAPAALHDHYRGCTAVDGWAQVVERALFEHHGWSWLDVDFTARSTPDGEGAAEVEFRWDGPRPGKATATVLIDGAVPVLDCGLPPEMARKRAARFELVDLRVDGAPPA